MSELLEPGVYSVFVLSDNGTWIQPNYRIGGGWTERALECMAINCGGRGSFYACGVGEDGDAPEESVEDLGDAPCAP